MTIKVNLLKRTFQASPFIVIYWEHGRLYAEEYYLHKKIECALAVVGILHFLTRPQSLRDLMESPILTLSAAQRRRVWTELRRLGFIKPTPQKTPAPTVGLARWGHQAGYFFWGTKDMNTFKPKHQRRAYIKTLSHETIPSLHKSYSDCETLFLRNPSYPKSLQKSLMKTQDIRNFSGGRISLNPMSAILKAALGPIGHTQTKLNETLDIKTSHSAGNRHPIEAYLVAHRVEKISPGLYHYNSKNHSLELIKNGNFDRSVFEIGCRQNWLKNASAYIILSAVFERTSWKYRHARALRMIFLDAGHLSQSINIAASTHGLGSCVTYSLNHTIAEKLLGLDPSQESVLTLTALGRPQNPPTF